MHKQTLYESDAKRIELSTWKDSRRCLVMHLQEWDRDDKGFESFMIFGSWSVTVAREACARATEAAFTRFYQAHIAKARETVAARVAMLASMGGGAS